MLTSSIHIHTYGWVQTHTHAHTCIHALRHRHTQPSTISIWGTGVYDSWSEHTLGNITSSTSVHSLMICSFARLHSFDPQDGWLPTSDISSLCWQSGREYLISFLTRRPLRGPRLLAWQFACLWPLTRIWTAASESLSPKFWPEVAHLTSDLHVISDSNSQLGLDCPIPSAALPGSAKAPLLPPTSCCSLCSLCGLALTTEAPSPWQQQDSPRGWCQLWSIANNYYYECPFLKMLAMGLHSFSHLRSRTTWEGCYWSPFWEIKKLMHSKLKAISSSHCSEWPDLRSPSIFRLLKESSLMAPGCTCGFGNKM